MVENGDDRKTYSGPLMRTIDSQALGEAHGQPVEVDSQGLSQPITEVVIDEKVLVPVSKSSVPPEPDNKPSSSESLSVKIDRHHSDKPLKRL